MEVFMSTMVKPTLIAGNVPVGYCCGDNVGANIEHYTLFYCQNPECDHLVCRSHLEPCGYCTGCCAEEHGLGSHSGG